MDFIVLNLGFAPTHQLYHLYGPAVIGFDDVVHIFDLAVLTLFRASAVYPRAAQTESVIWGLGHIDNAGVFPEFQASGGGGEKPFCCSYIARRGQAMSDCVSNVVCAPKQINPFDVDLDMGRTNTPTF